MKNEDFLLEEYKRYAEAFWKNEDVGEKRLNYFITLTTAIIAAVVTLLTANVTGINVSEISTAALLGIFLFGIATFFRMLQRDHVTDEYKSILDYLRSRIKQSSTELSDYELPFRKSRYWLFRGSLSMSVAIMNSIIIAVIPAIWLAGVDKWILIVGIFLISLFLHALGIKSRKNENKSSSQKFRAGVGAAILNTEQLVLALERKDIPGAWQLPQGGLEKREDPIQAVKREILEETGINNEHLTLITNKLRLLTYELPEKYRSKKTGRGQTQYWYLFKYTGDDKGIRLENTVEFKDWKWMTMENLASIVVHFRKPVYEELVKFFDTYKDEVNI